MPQVERVFGTSAMRPIFVEPEPDQRLPLRVMPPDRAAGLDDLEGLDAHECRREAGADQPTMWNSCARSAADLAAVATLPQPLKFLAQAAEFASNRRDVGCRLASANREWRVCRQVTAQ
jgi:hypothetical protein